MKKILCFGDILIDFISKDKGKTVAESDLFEKRAGGSIFNVAVGLSRLGNRVSFLAKVGNDEFGKYLKNVLKEENIDDKWISQVAGLNTTLAFASVDYEGKPSFDFHKDKREIAQVDIKDVSEISCEGYDLFHFGSTTVLESKTARTMEYLSKKMKEENVFVSFDPNVRPSLIKNKESFTDLVVRLIRNVDLLKLSDDDLQYLAGTKGFTSAKSTLEIEDNTIVVLTMGSKGAKLFYKGMELFEQGYSVDVAETTGCGDSFMSALISGLLEYDEPGSLDEESLSRILRRANASAAMVATRVGAAESMPYKEELEKFFKKIN
ncbi:MAG: carbohydrate kinase [Thermotogota bacterium]|nr:carbohydrate kinase [Thermotogota bacterium]